MKTTELYIEQVIIGLLVLATAVAPWTTELKGKLGDINIAEGSVLLGLAFLLGIPFDRFADTLSERLDRHHRLQFALNKWVGKRLPAAKPEPEERTLEQDIFAEDTFRLEGLRDQDAVVNWIEYHRSRIRLARALAVYGPALTLSLTLSMTRSHNGMSPREIGIWLSAVVAGYILWGIVANPPKSWRKVRFLRGLFGEQLPRTDDTQFIMYATKWYNVDGANTLLEPNRGFSVWSEKRSLVVPVLVLVVALLFGVNYGSKTAWIAGIGALVTVISTWSWWRISTTYRSYLYDLVNKRSRS